MTRAATIEFDLPLREPDVRSLDDRVYGPFESRLLLTTALERGMSTDDILCDTRIQADQLGVATTRISARQRLMVYRNIHQGCDDPTVFLRAGHAATICSFGIWGYALMSSSTYLDATRIAFKYLGLTGPLIEKTFDIEGETAVFEAKDRLLLGNLLQPVLDFWFAFIVRISKEVTQNAFTPRQIEFSLPAPEYAATYDDVFDCPVTFAAGRDRVCFGVENLALALPRADALSAQICDELCANMLKEMAVASGPARDVRDVILRTPGDFPSLTDVASQLYTTPRTLRRKLAEQGTSYQQILNDVRKRLAIKFLRETQLSMDEIAERVGFSDSRNFRQAFKKWTDSTPSSHRPL